ncbi:MAG TPA: universal stress protein [Gammaproteobacteria bacterium]|nr:universal stress protein [Gammaproteobacteria bacterium]
MAIENAMPMGFLESVVHATDFSPASERAFAHALAIAVLRRTELTLLHVTSGEHRDWTGFPAVRKTLERWNLLPPGSKQEDVLAAVGVRVSKIEISSRFPSLAVASWLESHPTDLLVVATEGREGVARWLHSSKAEAMARWSRTMTLFVPADAERSIVSAADGRLQLGSVLVPVDRLPDPSAAIELARRAADVVGDGEVKIGLLHVGDAASMPRLATEDGPRWKFEREVRAGDPVDEIVTAAARRAADLLVMPTAGRHGVFEALSGSTTERVLRRAPCPVLAVPARER